ncbi:MAG: hypothetical protein AB200_00485 [Parcubacteria bacterium C7867-005]|nr:MAG: hypothetical protein AB200_00485 [Parcubacteria bacterium C7867-005]
MQPSLHKPALVLVSIVILVVGLLWVLGVWGRDKLPEPVINEESMVTYEIIGRSLEGRKIESYTYGDGAKHILFVGGMHGGYEWNSVLLAYKFIDHLDLNRDFLSTDMKVSIIPTANPDGLYKVVGREGRFIPANVSTNKVVLSAGRFNARQVDLNRNFACKWKPESTWKSQKVSAGTKAFSEPEAVAIRDFVLKNKPDAVVFWHSQSNAVYASECEEGVLPATLDIMNAYAKASGYNPIKSFDAYEITGDAEGWLASIGIPAITVELRTHETIEFDQNLAGIKAILNYYSKI